MVNIKKVSAILITSVAMLALAGCPHHHHDNNYPPPPPPADHHDDQHPH